MPIRTAIGASPEVASASANADGIWVRARKALNTSAPIRMRKIIPVALAVSSRLVEKASQSSCLEAKATKPMAAAPTAAASVGVKAPT